MKTYKTTTEKPCLEIVFDQYAESPRKHNDNLGYFITCERNYNSPDDNRELESLIKNTGDEGENAEEHIEKIKTEMEANGYGKVLAIYPVYKYEHGGVVYRRGTAHGFDYSNCGFYIVTDKTAEVLGITPKDFEKVIDAELETYNKWANGEVYAWTLYDENGEIVDGGGDYYSLEEIRAELPEEWQNEKLEDYQTND